MTEPFVLTRTRHSEYSMHHGKCVYIYINVVLELHKHDSKFIYTCADKYIFEYIVVQMGIKTDEFMYVLFHTHFKANWTHWATCIEQQTAGTTILYVCGHGRRRVFNCRIDGERHVLLVPFDAWKHTINILMDYYYYVCMLACTYVCFFFLFDLQKHSIQELMLGGDIKSKSVFVFNRFKHICF